MYLKIKSSLASLDGSYGRVVYQHIASAKCTQSSGEEQYTVMLYLIAVLLA